MSRKIRLYFSIKNTEFKGWIEVPEERMPQFPEEWNEKIGTYVLAWSNWQDVEWDGAEPPETFSPDDLTWSDILV